MKRYFLLADAQTLAVFVSKPMETAPENSIEYFDCNFKKPVFDQFPNPEKVIEGITKAELGAIMDSRRAEICERYEEQIDKLVRTHCQRLQFELVELPERVRELRNDLIMACRAEIDALEKGKEVDGVVPLVETGGITKGKEK